MSGTENFCIGTVFFATLQEAINASKPGDVITISGSNTVRLLFHEKMRLVPVAFMGLSCRHVGKDDLT